MSEIARPDSTLYVPIVFKNRPVVAIMRRFEIAFACG